MIHDVVAAFAAAVQGHSGVAVFAVVVPIATAFIGALAAYFIARRSTSGNVETSDAAVLWRESQQMRAELRAQVEELRTSLKQTHDQLDECMNRVTALMIQVQDNE